MKYRTEIDGLRAVAVLPVILFHAGFEWFAGGYVGVDVFFVISGYLITTIIISEMVEGNFSLVNFYERRARRILPALFLVMLVCVPLAWFCLSPLDLKNFGKSLVAVSTFSSNILFWMESGYFDTAAELKPLLHTWSLAVEEQYYILFPLFLLLAWRLGIKSILTLLSLALVVSLGLAHWVTTSSVSQPLISGSFFLLPTRVWELLIGALLAFYLKYNQYPKSRAVNQSLSLLGFCMIVYSIVCFDQSTPFPSFYTLLPTIGTGLLILSAVPNTIVHKVLSFSPLVGIGLISYSAYLWHQPILAFARYRLHGELSGLLLIILCLSSLILAYLSWRWVEKPFKNKKKITRKMMFSFSLIGIILFSIGGMLTHEYNYLFTRVNPIILDGEIGHDAFHAHVSNNYYDCQDEYITSKAEVWAGFLRCNQTALENPTIALFGDSHAEHLFLGLGRETSQNLIYFIRGGSPFVGEQKFDYLVEHINESSQLGTIIYSAYWNRKYKALGEGAFYSKVKETIVAFTAHNKDVILIADVPDFIEDASHCYYAKSDVRSFCDIPRTVYQNQRNYLPVLRKISKELKIELIDPADLFCNKDVCSMVLDGTIMYRDNDHLNISGSKLVGEFIFRQSRLLGHLE